MPFVYKSSFDKANRTSLDAFRGVGLDEGLRILAEVRREIGVPVLTDVHEPGQIAAVAEVVDVLQTPAFLCRQTDFLARRRRGGQAGEHQEGTVPGAVGHAPRGREGRGDRQSTTCSSPSAASASVTTTWSSTCARSPCSRRVGCPVVFDATHSVQLPGGQGTASGGDRTLVPTLARAAVAVGVDAVFLEVHEDPDRALCDGATSMRLDDVPALLHTLAALARVVRPGAGG